MKQTFPEFGDQIELLEAENVFPWKNIYNLAIYRSGKTCYARLWRNGVMYDMKIGVRLNQKQEVSSYKIQFICLYKGKSWIVYECADTNMTKVALEHEQLLKEGQWVTDPFFSFQLDESSRVQILEGTPIVAIHDHGSHSILFGDTILIPPGRMDPKKETYACRFIDSYDIGLFADEMFGVHDGRLVYGYEVISAFGSSEDGVAPTIERRALVVGDQFYDGLHEWWIDASGRILALMDVNKRKSLVHIATTGPERIDSFLGERVIKDFSEIPGRKTIVYLTGTDGNFEIVTEYGSQPITQSISDKDYPYLEIKFFQKKPIAVVRSLYGDQPVLAQVYIPV